MVELAGSYLLNGLHSCEIKKSVHQIVQTAKITLPLSVVHRNNQLLERIKLAEKIKEGDSISIDLGYNGLNKNEFTGYIKRINLKQPLEIECEDELYLLRKTFYKKNFKKNSVKEVLNFLLQGLYDRTGLRLELWDKMPELTVTNFIIDNKNGVEVLQSIADTYFLDSYLTTVDGKKILYCGLSYGLKRDTINYQLDTNTVSHGDLKYDQTEEVKYRVKVINFKNDGSKYEYSYGDKKDQEIQKHYHGNFTDAELKRMADAEISKGIAGYRGSIETMLWPDVQPGDIVSIEDKQFGRSGTGYIGTVTTTFGNGARRKPEIDISL